MGSRHVLFGCQFPQGRPASLCRHTYQEYDLCGMQDGYRIRGWRINREVHFEAYEQAPLHGNAVRCPLVLLHKTDFLGAPIESALYVGLSEQVSILLRRDGDMNFPTSKRSRAKSVHKCANLLNMCRMYRILFQHPKDACGSQHVWCNI